MKDSNADDADATDLRGFVMFIKINILYYSHFSKKKIRISYNKSDL